MLSLAAFRYRNVLAEFGGPVANIETGPFNVRGRKLVLANATLNPGLTDHPATEFYSGTADGTGVDEVTAVARHIAVSEALERWAFSALSGSSDADRYGFDVDRSTCGMSAFPGLLSRNARRRSVLEAIERFSLMAWWEGLLPGQTFDTDWPGISALAIDGPFGGVTAVVHGETAWGGHVYGHAADTSITGAVERAILELARHEWVLRSWWISRIAGEEKVPTHLFEQRLVFFAGEEGHELFRRKAAQPASRRAPRPEVVCDCELPGPWSDYATVWRFAIKPPSDGYIHGGESYFFL